MSKSLVLKPRLSEQTYQQAQTNRVYVFDVPQGSNKHTVARTVVDQFEVKVETVNIANRQGKVKRTISLTGKRRSNSDGKKRDTKKAYVKLAKGFSLPVFAAIEKAEEEEQATQEKMDKTIAKQADKEAKPARRGLHLPGRRGARGGDK